MRSSFVAGAFGELLNPAGRKFLSIVIRLVVVLAPLLLASLFWASYRSHGSSATPAEVVTAARSPASPSKSQETAMSQSAHIDSSSREGFGNAQSAILFSVAPLASLPAFSTPADPDPVASFRQLIALPSDTTHEEIHIDPRRMRAIFDRGVVGYSSAKSDGERARSAGFIQTVALLGFSPARDLLSRNYPQSEAVRLVVPVKDIIRYALGAVMDGAEIREDAKQIFLALGQHFALQGHMDLFASQLLGLLRSDSRPQLGYRIDTLFNLLTRMPEACGALARQVARAGEAADRECSFNEELRRYIETTSPISEEEGESKRRGWLLLNQLGKD